MLWPIAHIANIEALAIATNGLNVVGLVALAFRLGGLDRTALA